MPARTRPPSTPSAPFVRWADADPETVVAHLESDASRLDAATVGAIRDRAAAFYHAEPARAFLIATALVKRVRRMGEHAEPVVRATAWRCLAEVCMFMGRLQQARRAYERATEEAHGLTGLTGQILVGRVTLLSLLGEAAEARKLAARAERLLARAGDLVYLGKLHVNQGNAHYQRDRYADALASYHKAAEVLERADVRDATTVALLTNQGIACTNLARIDEARRFFLRAEAQCEKLGLASLGAQAHYNRAFLEALRGDYRLALQLLEIAEQVFEEQGILDMVAASQRARAEIYLDLGMPAEARDLAARAAAGFTKQGMAFDAALCQADEARGLILLGDADAALLLLSEADGFFRARGHRSRRAVVKLLEARALLHTEPARAARLAGSAAASFARMKAHCAGSEARRVLAEARLVQGRAGSAERALLSSEPMTERLPVGERLQVWALAGRIAADRRRDPEAKQRLRRAIRHLEAERRLIPGIELRARAFGDRVRVYHDLLAVTLRSARPRFEEILQLVEAARARGFRERAQVRDARTSARPDRTDEQLAAERVRLSSLTRRLEEAEYPERGAPDPGVIRGLRTEIQALERSLADQIRRAEALGPGAQTWQGTACADEIAARLQADETLIEYALLGEQVLALVLSRRARAYRLLPVTTATLRAQVERIRFQLDALALAPHPDETLDFQRRSAEAVLHELHDTLVWPLQDLLPAQGRLIFVPQHFLHRVPFECLRDAEHYIDDRYIVSRCATADELLRRGQRSRRRGVLVSGTIAGGPAAVGPELDEVAAHLAPCAPRVLRDAPAQTIMEAMSACRVIHLSAHGTFREDNPMFSRLSTVDGGLFLIDLVDRRLDADLVVLSACNSGQVFTGRGDDLAGVAHGFLAAGARQLVASTWRVHDDATRQLMGHFYRHYAPGVLCPGPRSARGPRRGDPAAALRAAARDLRAQWNHPFYWGSFSVHGV
jgi:CHAT domain-containing protein